KPPTKPPTTPPTKPPTKPPTGPPTTTTPPGTPPTKPPHLPPTGSREELIAASAVSVALVAGGVVLYRRGRRAEPGAHE
ncbi:hypothetical protein ACKI14_30565, partial [Streptomyces turgidiscabies]